MIRTSPDQKNLIDGTILAFEPQPDGAYVTFAGSDESPIIASIDIEDLERLGGSVLHAASDFKAGVASEEQARVTPRGIEILKSLLSEANPDPESDPATREGGFSFFAEPAVIEINNGVHIVIGTGDGRETGARTCLGISNPAAGYCEGMLTRDQLEGVIAELQGCLEAMDICPGDSPR